MNDYNESNTTSKKERSIPSSLASDRFVFSESHCGKVFPDARLYILTPFNDVAASAAILDITQSNAYK